MPTQKKGDNMADLDGVVRIGTEIDDSGFKKGMQNIEKTAKNGAQGVTKQLNNADKSVDELGDEAKNTSKDLNKFSKELKDAGKESGDFSKNIDKSSKGISSLGSFLGAGLITNGITSLVSGFMSAVSESEEFTRSLSRLETNAQNAGLEFAQIEENFKNFTALTNEADSSAEALSNLMQTGFDNAGITKSVEALSGAVVKFPDTLNIESLADGLQETLATGTATGQFAELLDRLGIGADNFSASLANTTSQAEKQQLVLDTLSNAGLNDLYEQYSETNSATLEFNKSQAELDMAMSNFVQGTLPLFSDGFSLLSGNILSLSEAFKEGGISGFLSEAGNIASDFANTIAEEGPQMAEAGYQMLLEFVQGFVDNLPSMTVQISEFYQKFFDVLKTHFPKVIEKGKELLTTFISGFFAALPTFFQELPKIIIGISEFVAESFPELVKSGIEIMGSIIVGIVQAIPGIVVEMPALIAAIFQAIINLASGIYEIGEYIVEGIFEGISAAKTWLLNKVKEWCGSVLEEIMAFFGINSPSTVMRDKVGKNLVYGMIEGITSLNKKLENSLIQPVQNANAKIKNIDFSKNFVKILNNAAETAKKEANSYQEVSEILIQSIQAGIDENKESLISSVDDLINNTVEAFSDDKQKEEAKKAAEELMQSYKDALETGAQNIKDYISSSLNQITEEFQTQYDDIISKQQSLEETLGGSYLFEIEDNEVFIEDVQKSIDILNSYREALNNLKERGISNDILNQISNFSAEEGLQIINELLKMTDEDFSSFNEKWAEKQQLANEISEEFYAEQLENLKKTYIDEMMNTLESMPENVYSIGIDTIDSWIQGMNNKLPSLMSTARELANSVLQSMQEELGINSPSTEGIYMGQMIDEGVAKGISNGANDVRDSIKDLGFFESIKNILPQMQNMVFQTMSNIAPIPSYAGGVIRNESVQTINNNSTQTFEIVTNSSAIYDLVQKEGRRRGKSLLTNRGII